MLNYKTTKGYWVGKLFGAFFPNYHLFFTAISNSWSFHCKCAVYKCICISIYRLQMNCISSLQLELDGRKWMRDQPNEKVCLSAFCPSNGRFFQTQFSACFFLLRI